MRANPVLGAQSERVSVPRSFRNCAQARRSGPGARLRLVDRRVCSANLYPPGHLPTTHHRSRSRSTESPKKPTTSSAAIYWQDYTVPSVGLRPFFVYGPGRDQGVELDADEGDGGCRHGTAATPSPSVAPIPTSTRTTSLRVFIQAARTMPAAGRRSCNLGGTVASWPTSSRLSERGGPGEHFAPSPLNEDSVIHARWRRGQGNQELLGPNRISDHWTRVLGTRSSVAGPPPATAVQMLRTGNEPEQSATDGEDRMNFRNSLRSAPLPSSGSPCLGLCRLRPFLLADHDDHPLRHSLDEIANFDTRQSRGTSRRPSCRRSRSRSPILSYWGRYFTSWL